MRIMFNSARYDYPKGKWKKPKTCIEEIDLFTPCSPENDAVIRFTSNEKTPSLSMQPVDKEIVKKIAEDLLNTGYADLSKYKDIVFAYEDEYQDASRNEGEA